MPTRPALAGPEPLEPREVPSAADDLPVVPRIDGAMQAHLRDVAALGRALGNRENVFAKVGDSITAYRDFLTPLGAVGYNPFTSGLATTHPDLLAVWAAYLTPVDPTENSFSRTSLSAWAAHSGLQIAPTVPVELDAIHPAISLVMVGTNDYPYPDPVETFRATLRGIIQANLDRGVIPVVSTIPDLDIGGGAFAPWTAQANEVIVEEAARADVPVWNYWRSTDPLPFHGLHDALHPTTAPQGSGYFGPGSQLFGFNVRNLEALEVLQKVRDVVFGSALPDDYQPPAAADWQPLPAGARVAAVGAARGSAPEVQVLDPAGRVLDRLIAYDPAFLGGVSAAAGDVNGDGVPDVVTAPGPGGGPLVRAFSGADGRELFSFFAFEPAFTGGVSVALDDLDGDGKAELVVGAGAGGGPRVRVFHGGDLAPLGDFLAFAPSFTGGVSVAAADFGPGVGPAVAVGPGAGGGGVVSLLAPDGRPISTMAAFPGDYRGGVTVAAGDLGGGAAGLAVGTASGGTDVRVLKADGTQRAAFSPGGSARQGVRVAVVPAGGASPGCVVTLTADSTNPLALFDPDGRPAGR